MKKLSIAALITFVCITLGAQTTGVVRSAWTTTTNRADALAALGGASTNATNVTMTGAFTGNGASLTNVNGTNIVGTIPDARLGTNVALLNAASNNFAGAGRFTLLYGNGSNLTGIAATGGASLTANQTFTGSNVFKNLVLSNASGGVALDTTNGSLNVHVQDYSDWSDIAAGGFYGVFHGDGLNVSNINASSVYGNHTLADSVLSTNVPLLNAASNHFNGDIKASSFYGNGNNLAGVSNSAHLADNQSFIGRNVFRGLLISNNIPGIALDSTNGSLNIWLGDYSDHADIVGGQFFGAFSGNGVNLTNLNAQSIYGNHTLTDGVLSANVPLLNNTSNRFIASLSASNGYFGGLSSSALITNNTSLRSFGGEASLEGNNLKLFSGANRWAISTNIAAVDTAFLDGGYSAIQFKHVANDTNGTVLDGSSFSFSKLGVLHVPNVHASQAIMSDSSITATSIITSSIRLDGSASGHTTISVPNAAGSDLVLPNSAGASGQVLQTDGAGNLSWTPMTTSGTNGGVASINGATNAIQTIVGAGGVSVTTTGGTHTVSMAISTLTPGAGLSGSAFNGSTPRTFAVAYGTSSNTAARGDDSRFIDGTNDLNTALTNLVKNATNGATVTAKAYADAATNAVLGTAKSYTDSHIQQTNGFITSPTATNIVRAVNALDNVLTNHYALAQLNRFTSIDQFYIQDSTNNTETTFNEDSSGNLTIQSDGGNMTFLGEFYAVGLHGGASGLTNGSPTLATNNAAATDGMVLSKTGNNLKFIAQSSGGIATNATSLTYSNVATGGIITTTNGELDLGTAGSPQTIRLSTGNAGTSMAISSLGNTAISVSAASAFGYNASESFLFNSTRKLWIGADGGSANGTAMITGSTAGDGAIVLNGGALNFSFDNGATMAATMNANGLTTAKVGGNGAGLTNLQTSVLYDWMIFKSNHIDYAVNRDGVQRFSGASLDIPLQAALNSSSNLYGTVFQFASNPKTNGHPEYYIISNTVTVTINGAQFVGQGNSSTTIQPATGYDHSLLDLGTVATDIGGIFRMRGLRWEGGNGGNNCIGVRVVHCPEPNIKDCEFQLFGRSGLEFTNHTILNWADFVDDWFLPGPLSNSACVLFSKDQGSGNAYYGGPRFQGCHFGPFGANGSGIIASNYVQFLTIQNSIFFGQTCCVPNTNAWPVYIANGDNITIQGNNFQMAVNTGLQFDLTGPCIEFGAQNSATNINSLVSGNTVYGTNTLVKAGANVLGLNVTGNMTNNTVAYAGDGSGLTNLPASTTTAFTTTTNVATLNANFTNTTGHRATLRIWFATSVASVGSWGIACTNVTTGEISNESAFGVGNGYKTYLYILSPGDVLSVYDQSTSGNSVSIRESSIKY